MQAMAAESSGYAGQFRCFGKKNFKTFCLNSFTLNPVLEQARQRLFKNFLARNELAASAFA
jgi:hypothetical protein